MFALLHAHGKSSQPPARHDALLDVLKSGNPERAYQASIEHIQEGLAQQLSHL